MSKSKSIENTVALIHDLDDQGFDKNQIMKELLNLHYDDIMSEESDTTFSSLEKWYKDSGVGKKKCYRTKTTEMFVENPDLTLDEWSRVMILENYLSVPVKFQNSDDDTKIKEGIKNYRQLFPMFVALVGHMSMKELHQE